MPGVRGLIGGGQDCMATCWHCVHHDLLEMCRLAGPAFLLGIGLMVGKQVAEAVQWYVGMHDVHVADMYLQRHANVLIYSQSFFLSLHTLFRLQSGLDDRSDLPCFEFLKCHKHAVTACAERMARTEAALDGVDLYRDMRRCAMHRTVNKIAGFAVKFRALKTLRLLCNATGGPRG
jgi:hypothetical protein